MPGIDLSVITHRLNVSSSYKPIRQKKRVFSLKRDNAIKKEVHKLVTTEFKWRMCVDFKDLYKACPKDSYPLPRIDQLVDSTVGH